jgi:hypothetical protein
MKGGASQSSVNCYLHFRLSLKRQDNRPNLAVPLRANGKASGTTDVADPSQPESN